MGIRTKFSSMGINAKLNYNKFMFKVDTSLAENSTISLNISKYSTTYVNPINIDWGDGVTEVFSSGNPSHKYSIDGIYQIKIFSDTNKMPYIDFRICKYIISVDSAFLETYKNNTITTSFDSCFDTCTNLKNITKDLFKNNVGITSLYATFNTCTGLEYIPDTLFDKCVNISDFNQCFRACQNLKYVPSNLFDYQTNITDLSYCFFICENITSSVPKVWLKFPNASKFNCFYGCSNASNYSDIPDEWK